MDAIKYQPSLRAQRLDGSRQYALCSWAVILYFGAGVVAVEFTKILVAITVPGPRGRIKIPSLLSAIAGCMVLS